MKQFVESQLIVAANIIKALNKSILQAEAMAVVAASFGLVRNCREVQPLRKQQQTSAPVAHPLLPLTVISLFSHSSLVSLASRLNAPLSRCTSSCCHVHSRIPRLSYL